MECPISISQQYTDRADQHIRAAAIRHHQVALAVPVHIRHRHEIGTRPARAVGHRRMECPISVPEQHADCRGRAYVCDYNVGLTVSVHIRYRH